MSHGVVEFWVMRVVVSIGPTMMSAVASRVASGEYQVINGDVCEPIECYQDPDMERAQRLAVERAQREHASTGCVHKVVMSADF